ncbi:MAG: hypothetical protein J5892_02520 [Bacilli bacterium]|nr:hypothetical protein [Bacilli bacterium]
MKKIITFVICSFLLLPIFALAAECDNKEIVRLKTEASKVGIKLIDAKYPKLMHSDDADEDYIVEIPYLKLYFSNLSKDLKYQIVKDSYVLWDSSDATIENNSYTYPIVDNYDSIRTLTVVIGSNNADCLISSVRKEDVTIPMLNPYRNLSICKDVKDFYLCQDFWYQDYTGVKIDEKVNKYKNNEIDEKGKKKESKTFLKKIGEFIKKHAIFFIAAGAVIVGVVVFLIIRRRIIMKKHFG